MRVALIGTTALSLTAARDLLRRKHDVVIVERDKVRIDALAEDLDCGFVHGDGTKPAILRELGVGETDALLCLTNNDQDNILAALVARSLGFKRVVPKIMDPELEPLCTELGLSDTIVPDVTIARTLADALEGRDPVELSTMVRGAVRFFSFVVAEGQEQTVAELALPKRAQAICVYRGDDFLLPDASTALQRGDEVVLITHAENLPTLHERWKR